MGYKLAGFDVIGCNEIDPKMMEAYRINHNPKYSYLEPIQTFKVRNDLPEELYELDILDGSPPCSSFSMAGNREKDWGKEKKFREGQAKQILDDLFFDFIDLAKKLQPKVVVAENVKGLLLGEAKSYVRRIYKEFEDAGYYLQHFLLDSSKMGVPQRRERVFFIALRRDLAAKFLYQMDMFTVIPKIQIEFNGSPILYKEIKTKQSGKRLTPETELYWNNRQYGDNDFSEIIMRMTGKQKQWNRKFIYDDMTPLTITAGGYLPVRYDEPFEISNDEIKMIGTYPMDYDVAKNKIEYLVGMSVPPLMTAGIADEIYNQWISKLY